MCCRLTDDAGLVPFGTDSGIIPDTNTPIDGTRYLSAYLRQAVLDDIIGIFRYGRGIHADIVQFRNEHCHRGQENHP